MSKSNEKAASQSFLDTRQYSRNSILKYERIFGHTWVSTGGENTTKEFCLKMNLKPGQKILDVGCGTGGSAFYISRQYGLNVVGIDLSTNMIDIAQDRLNREEEIIKDRVSFSIGDIMEVDYSSNEFDVIYSRDTILHINDKEELFKRMLPWLKPGGILLVTDYCRGNQKPSEEFSKYIEGRGYDLRTVAQYGEVINQAGYKDVEAHDMSKTFSNILKEELKYFVPIKESFIQDFSQSDFDEIKNGWELKVERVAAGDQAWGMFIAKR